MMDMHKLNQFVTLIILVVNFSSQAIENAIYEKLDKNKQLVGAIYNGNLEEVKEAIEKGADVDYIDEYRGTSLMAAFYYRQYHLVKFLIDSKANVNIADKGLTALHYAAYQQAPDYVFKLLIGAHADVNAQSDNGNTPLLAYLGKGYGLDLSVIQLLLDAGADTNLKNKANEGPIELATKFEKVENREPVLKLLKDWQEKTRKAIKQETDKYILPDLGNIICEYLI